MPLLNKRKTIITSISFVLASYISTPSYGGTSLKKLEELKIIDSVYQVFLARSATKAELHRWSGSTVKNIAGELRSSKEYVQVFTCRIQDFVNGGHQSVYSRCTVDGPKLDPSYDLNQMLEPFSSKTHQNQLCPNENNRFCFAKWLSGRLMTELPTSLSQRETLENRSLSYDELLGELIR